MVIVAGLYSIAFAIVNEETNANWPYFFQHLTDAVGIDRKIAFVSDRNNGILEGRSLYSLTALMHFATTI